MNSAGAMILLAMLSGGLGVPVESNADITQLEAKNAQLEATIAQLEANNAQLEANNLQCEAKNAQLEEQVGAVKDKELAKPLRKTNFFSLPDDDELIGLTDAIRTLREPVPLTNERARILIDLLPKVISFAAASMEVKDAVVARLMALAPDVSAAMRRLSRHFGTLAIQVDFLDTGDRDQRGCGVKLYATDDCRGTATASVCPRGTCASEYQNSKNSIERVRNDRIENFDTVQGLNDKVKSYMLSSTACQLQLFDQYQYRGGFDLPDGGFTTEPDACINLNNFKHAYKTASSLKLYTLTQ